MGLHHPSQSKVALPNYNGIINRGTNIMALRFFRKHQKKLLVVFGVAIMFAFLLPSASMQCGSSQGPAQAEQTVVEWSDGGKENSLVERQLHFLRVRHAAVFRFLMAVVQTAEQKNGTPQAAGLRRNPNTGMIVEPGISRNNSEESLVLRLLLAQKAREIGLVVDDQAVQQFLGQLSGNMLSPNDLRGIRAQALGDQWNEDQLFRVLQEELLAQKMMIIAEQSGTGTTPGDFWDYFNRLRREVTTEVLPLDISDFVELADTPTPDQVSALYEEYKHREPVAGSPDPGFKRPKRIALEYLVADMRDYQAVAEKSITDEQVSAYYDENLEEFRRTEPPQPSESAEDDSEGGDVEGDSVEGSDLDSNETDAVNPDAGNPDAGNPDAGERANSVPPNDPRQATAHPPGLADPRLAAVRPPVPVEESQSDANGTTPEPGSEDTELGDADLELDDSLENGIGEEDTTTPTADSDLDLVDSTSSDQPDYGHKPLSEVSDQIRATLAIPLAQQQLTEQFSAINKELKKYSDDHQLWELDKDDPELVEPRRPDFQELADRFGLKTGVVPLVPQQTLVADYEIGRSRPFGAGGRIGITDVVFSDDLRQFKPIQSEFFEFNPDSLTDHTHKVYVLWKTDESATKVPELEEIKEDVILAWKMREAVSLATLEAEKIAAKLNDSKLTMQEAFENQPDREFKTVGPFTWYTPMVLNEQYGAQLFLSSVEGVEDVGTEFMRGVFSLRVGEAGPAVNRSETAVYVVRIQSDLPNLETRQSEFFKMLDESGGASAQIVQIASSERQRHLIEWVNDLRKEMKVEWKQQPKGAVALQ